MGLFARQVECPSCRHRGAVKALWGSIRCPNPQCLFHDATLPLQESVSRTSERPGGSRSGPRQDPVLEGDFSPGDRGIEIEYCNFMGEQKTFVGDWTSLRQRGNHISLRVVPTGCRIALSRDRIQNLQTLEDVLRKVPTSREQNLIRFHLRRGTTSAAFEALRMRYPEWSRGMR